MANYNQAPRITNSGKPANEGSFMTMNWKIFTAINQKIDNRHSTAKMLMMLLVGSGDGFRLAQKTALERLGCSKDAYYDARNYLEKIGLITNDKEKNEIVIHYNALLSSLETTSSKEKSSTETYSMSSLETYSKGRLETYHNIKEIEKEIYKKEAQAPQSGLEANASNRLQEGEVKGIITRKELEKIGLPNINILGNGIIQSKITGFKFRLSN